jgi:hypothetical protein
MRGQQESVLLFTPDLEQVKGFVHRLNTKEFQFLSPDKDGARRWVSKDYRPVQAELHRLVSAWSQSGPNVSKLLAREPILARASQRFQAHLVPTNTGVAKLTYTPVSETLNPVEPLTTALGLFIGFLLNPYNKRLSGPCAYCGQYFVKETQRKKTVYCSEVCGHRVTSRIANQKERERVHVEQLQRVDKSLAEWSVAITGKDWKDWVHVDTQISKNWLTRANKRGEISVPVKRGLKNPKTKQLRS